MHLLALIVVVAGGAELALLAAAELTASPEVLIANFPKEGCPRLKDTNTVNSCIKANIEHFAKVLKERKPGLPEIDPYFAGDVNMDFRAGPADLKLSFSNMSIHGLTDVVFHKVRSELKPDSMKIDLNLTFVQVGFKADYKMGGRFSTWDFTGHGPAAFSFSDVKAFWQIIGEKEPGSKYLSIKSVTPTYTVGGMEFHAGGLVDGHPSISNLVVVLVNRLWTDVVEIGKPFAQKPISNHLRMMAESVFKIVPYDTMFPEA